MARYCYFWIFCKGYSKAKWLQNGRFWERSSNQPTTWLIHPHVKETGTSKWRKHSHVFTWTYAIHFIPTNMVWTRVRGNLRMRKQNTKTKVPLDVVPERRTKPFPPRFRPVGRFCELRFRYLSSPTGREGEISHFKAQTPCWPLVVFHTVWCGDYWCKIDAFTHAHCWKY